MPKREPFTWQPNDIIDVTNNSRENLLLELKSGSLRLDSGRSLRLTGSALDQASVKALVDGGMLTVQRHHGK